MLAWSDRPTPCLLHYRHNNFDLLRLVAATQVVFIHSFGYTELYETGPAWAMGLFEFVALFPGVPIFFICSGFLVAMSWERSPDQLGRFFWKRLLRIYPALLACLAVSLLVVGIAGYLTRDFVGSPTFAAWLAGQATIVQSFNPEHLRNFGLGVLNGSLWTIGEGRKGVVFGVSAGVPSSPPGGSASGVEGSAASPRY
jgi:peptidoglycan/LPS O-acetylase OafA/YrhL